MSLDNRDETLFPEAEIAMDSPRLAWMKRHGIVTFRLPADLWMAGFQAWRPDVLDPAQFFCDETGANGDSRIGMADTEDEALADLLTCGYARERGIRLWNEEGA